MGPRLRILFVCAMNRRRSVTAERIYRNDARLELRSAGTREGSPRRVSAADLNWADIVFVMERRQKQWLLSEFQQLELPEIEVLDVPDDYELMDPALQELLRAMLDPEIAHRLDVLRSGRASDTGGARLPF
jgi:predicted protein tyrosine phosphatase